MGSVSYGILLKYLHTEVRMKYYTIKRFFNVHMERFFSFCAVMSVYAIIVTFATEKSRIFSRAEKPSIPKQIVPQNTKQYFDIS